MLIIPGNLRWLKSSMKNKLKLGFKTKHYIIVYEKGKLLSGLSKEREGLIEQYIKDYPLSKNDTVWLDEKNNKCFSKHQYRKTKAGKDHHFQCAPSSFISGGFWSAQWCMSVIEKYKLADINEYFFNKEIVLLKDKINLENKNKSVLIVCGGPSVNEVKWENLTFDKIWTCNQFYKNKKLTEKKVDLSIIVSGLFDYNREEEFIEQVENTDISILFELERGNPNSQPKMFEKARSFYKKYKDQTVFCQTRYASALGIGPRLAVIAALCGFKDIYIVGLDGRSQIETNGNLLHAFDGNKNIPNWYKKHGDDFQERQMIIFWEYMLELSELNDFNFYNLGEGTEFNVLTDLFYNDYPLPREAKEAIK